jgi:hypothetical protein
MIYVNGDVYEGEFYHGVKHGKGKMFYANGDVYEGDFKDDEKCGMGVMIHLENIDAQGLEVFTVYRGKFWCDKKSGYGQLSKCHLKKQPSQTSEIPFSIDSIKVEKMLSIYKGYFMDDLPNGHGKYEDKFQASIGYFKDGELEGRGEKVFKDEHGQNLTILKGSFTGGLLNDEKGKVCNKDFSYVGGVRDNVLNGKGEIKYADGGIYEGEFNDGRRNGFGKFEIKGNGYIGEWRDDKKHGKGESLKVEDKNEIVSMGEWNNDQFLNGKRTTDVSIWEKWNTFDKKDREKSLYRDNWKEETFENGNMISESWHNRVVNGNEAKRGKDFAFKWTNAEAEINFKNNPFAGVSSSIEQVTNANSMEYDTLEKVKTSETGSVEPNEHSNSSLEGKTVGVSYETAAERRINIINTKKNKTSQEREIDRKKVNVGGQKIIK